MSGGSYNYVCFWEPDTDAGKQLQRMATRLEELGYRGAAAETTELVNALKINPHLRNAWRAVEWFDSQDWSEETARHNIEDSGWRRYEPRTVNTHESLNISDD